MWKNIVSSNFQNNDVPFTIADATTLTEAGYVGEDVKYNLKLPFDYNVVLKRYCVHR